MSRVITTSLILVLVVASGFGAYLFRNKKAVVTEKYTGPIEKLRVGNVAEYNLFNHIAKEKSYFTDNGLDVDIKDYASGPASLAGLIAGEVDIAVAADFVGVRNIFDHPDLKIIAQVNQHRVFQVAAKKDVLSRPSDLKGKKVGITNNSAGVYFMGNYLNESNMKLEDITVVDLTPAEMIEQVIDGRIDAMVVFEPNIYKLKQRLGENFVSWDIQGDQNIGALLYTTKDYFDKNSALIKRYVESLVKAEVYYQSNQQEIKDLVEQKLGYERAYVDYSWPKFTHRINLNQELVLNMEEEARWVIGHGLTTQTKVPNYLNNIDVTILESIKPESVTIVH